MTNSQRNSGESSRWGRSDGRAVGNGVRVDHLAQPPAPNSTSWIGEQADPWGDGLPSKESRRSYCRNNGVGSSRWGRSDGRAVGNGVRVNHLAEPPAPSSTSWIGERADPWGDGLPSKESRRSHRRKNGVDSSGWGRSYGQPIERMGRAEIQPWQPIGAECIQYDRSL